LLYGALFAYSLGFGDLEEGGAGVAHREKQFRVGVLAQRILSPGVVRVAECDVGGEE
jgi:hypothetical protein